MERAATALDVVGLTEKARKVGTSRVCMLEEAAVGMLAERGKGAERQPREGGSLDLEND